MKAAYIENIKVLILTISLLITFLYPIGAGTRIAQFSRLASSARLQGIGEASVSLSGDLDNIFINPAGIYAKSHLDTSLIFSLYSLDMNFLSLAARIKPGSWGDLAFSFSVLGSGKDSPRTTRSGFSLTETGQTVNTSSLLTILSYSTRLRNSLGLGLSLKLENDLLSQDYIHTAFSVDTGLIFDFGLFSEKIRGLALGVSLQNLGTSLKDWKAPYTLRGGLSWRIKILDRNSITPAFDIEKVLSGSLIPRLGLNIEIMQTVFLRGAWNTSEGFSFGGGVNIKGISFDYAIAMGGLEMKNWFELGYGLPERPEGGVDPEAVYLMGIRAFNAKELEKAARLFKAVLRLDPGYKDAEDRLKEAQELLEKQQRLELFRQAMQEAE